jgi:signal transduction histidine kinase
MTVEGFGDGNGDPPFFAALLEAIGDGLAVVDSGGEVGYLNGRARELLGIPPESVPPLALSRHAPELFLHLREALEGGRGQVFELAVTYPERRFLRVSCLPFPASAKHFHALVLGDRTAEETRSDARLEDETCAAVHLLAGEMAHDLGNPLNTLQIQLQLLQRQLKTLRGGAGARRTVEVCRDEVGRMHRLVARFLGAIRPATPLLCRLDLAPLLEHCLEVQRAELEQRGIAVEPQFPKNLPPILGDGEQLRRVFFNLLRNALEALEGGGTLTVRGSDEGAFLRVEIEDSGVGIDPGVLAHLLRNPHSSKRLGNGLGLLIVRRILRAHRATLTLASLEPHGTRVTLRFPLENPKFPELSADTPPPAHDDRIPLAEGKFQDRPRPPP